MKGHIQYIVITLLCILAAACSKKMSDPQLTDIPIKVSAGLQTKASIFDTQASLTNSEIGGGNMIVSAYITEGEDAGTTPFIDNVRVTYFADAKDWRFTNAAGAYVNYYWPKQDKLDFFAYFPMDITKTGVTSVAYTYKGGPSFNYSLPLDNQEDLQEFIYSYVQKKDASTGNVQLDFHHPFAAVKFELGMSYRLMMHSIKLTNIYYTGSYSTDEDGIWQMTQEEPFGNLDISIGKGVPDQINFNSPIGGPYMVAPQTIPDAAEFQISFTRLDGQPETKTVKLYNLGGITKWEAGKLYTYNLSLGNTEEEILFKVTVENWKIIDHKNDIDVE